MQTQYKYRGERTLAVQVNPNLMKQTNDTLGYSENSNKRTESLFVIAKKLWKLGKMGDVAQLTVILKVFK